MLSIPISAVCKSPKVTIEPEEKLNFGEVFLEFEERKTITLRNESNLHA